MLAELIFSRFRTGFESEIDENLRRRISKRGEAWVYGIVIEDVDSTGVLNTKRAKSNVLRVLNERSDQINIDLRRMADVSTELKNKRQSRIDWANQAWLASAGLGALIGSGRAFGWW